MKVTWEGIKLTTAMLGIPLIISGLIIFVIKVIL